MVRLDSMSLAAAFVLGTFLPNYLIVVAAAGNVLQAGLPQARAIAVMLLFNIVASAGVGPPLPKRSANTTDATSEIPWRLRRQRHSRL